MAVDVLPRHPGNARRLRNIAVGHAHQVRKIGAVKVQARFAVGQQLPGGLNGLAGLARQPQIGQRDRSARVDDHGALDRVLEFAHVARPVRGFQRGDRVALQRARGLVELAVEVVQEKQRQRQDVVAALAQRRHPKRHDVDAVEQVGAEAAGRHLLLQRLVGGADQAETGRALHRAAQPHETAFLQHAQQADLELGAQVGDLVEQDRAVVGLLEVAGRGLDGAGESALLEAEQRRLGQRLRQCAAVECLHRSARAGAQGMEQLGDDLLAGAAFAFDQHCRVQRRGLAQLRQQPLHGHRVADHHRVARAGVDEVAQVGNLAVGAIHLQRLVDHRLQLLQVLERLGEVVEQAIAHRPHRVAHLGMAGDHDGRLARPQLAHVGEQIKAVAIGQALVEDGQVEIAKVEGLARLGHVGGRDQIDRPSTKQAFEQPPGEGVVVDEEDFGLHG